MRKLRPAWVGRPRVSCLSPATSFHLSSPGAVPLGSRPHPVGGRAALLGSPPCSQPFTHGSGGVGWCRSPSSLSPRVCLVPPPARVAGRLLSHSGPWWPHLHRWAGPGAMFAGARYGVAGLRLCRYTRVPRQVSCRRGACPRPGGVPRTCCTATFDLLLRLWVWPRPRSRLLREVWARVPARRLGARRGGPGRAGAACRACGQGDEGTCGARPSFLDSGSWAQGTARPHPSLPSLTPSTWPLCSELPKLALMG